MSCYLLEENTFGPSPTTMTKVARPCRINLEELRDRYLLERVDANTLNSEELQAMTDEELMLLVQARKYDAFSELVERNSKKFYFIAYGVLFNQADAEDIVQDAFVKLWTKPEKWNPEKKAKFSTWFTIVVTNMCIDFKRKKKPIYVEDEIEPKGDSVNLEEEYFVKERSNLMKKLISELSEKQALAINLCYLRGLSNKEAAEIMDLNLKALESLLVRGRKALKDKLAQYNLSELKL